MSSLSDIFSGGVNHNNVSEVEEKLAQIAKKARDPRKVEAVAESILDEAEALQQTGEYKSLILKSFEDASDLTNDDKVKLYIAIQGVFDSLEKSQAEYKKVEECCSLLSPTIQQLRGSRYVSHIGRLPGEVMVLLLSSIDNVDLATAAQVGKEWYSIAHKDELWKVVAERIGFKPVKGLPLFEQLTTHIGGLRKNIRDLGGLPHYVEGLLEQRPTIENVRQLKEWKEARDALAVWEKVAGAIDSTDFPSLDGCVSCSDTILKAKGFGPWIEENQTSLSSLSELDLSNSHLTQIPEAIASLHHLKQMTLHHNQLSDVPVWMGNNNNLQILDLSHNQLAELPEWVGNLAKLEMLNLSNNRLIQVPESIGKLCKLKRLYLSNNQLAQVPESIKSLQSLEVLHLCNNKLTMPSEGISKLLQLRDLNLSDNQLSKLPEEIGKLSMLRKLSFSNNNFTDFPQEVINLKMLSIINLANNPLKTAPLELGKLEKIEVVDISHIKFSKLPEDFLRMMRNRGVKVISI